jgi:hypothetical protein
MSRHTFMLSIAMLCSHFDLAQSQSVILASKLPHIRTVPSDTLTDLAVSFADPDDPVIYYNPRLLERFGPEITAFVLAHERAHIRLGHRRPTPLTVGTAEALERLLQSWELDADCLAAVWLARERPSALEAATTLFQRMGSGRVDREHPRGSARAAQLQACGRTPNGDLHFVSEGPRGGVTTTSFK